MENKKQNTFGGTFAFFSYALARKLDLKAACVYGHIFNKCKLAKGYCYESYPTIAKQLGISVNSVRRAVKELVEIRVVIDITESKCLHPTETKKLMSNPERLAEIELEMNGADIEQEENETSANLEVASAKLAGTSANLESTSANLESTSAKLGDKKYKELYKEKEKENSDFSFFSSNPLLEDVRSSLETVFKRKLTGNKWLLALQHVYDDATKKKFKQFSQYFESLVTGGFDAKYLTPDKIIELWDESISINKNSWKDPMPIQIVEDTKEYAPMPKDFGKRKNDMPSTSGLIQSL